MEEENIEILKMGIVSSNAEIEMLKTRLRKAQNNHEKLLKKFNQHLNELHPDVNRDSHCEY